MQDLFDSILQRERTLGEQRSIEAAKNRALMAAHMPDCLRMIDQLKEAGMFGRVVMFHVEQKEAA